MDCSRAYNCFKIVNGNVHHWHNNNVKRHKDDNKYGWTINVDWSNSHHDHEKANVKNDKNNDNNVHHDYSNNYHFKNYKNKNISVDRDNSKNNYNGTTDYNNN